MSLVTGDNVMLYVYDGGQWKPVVCGRSCTLHINRETIETSITGTGSWRKYVTAGITWDCSIEGAVYLQKVNTLALPDMTTFLVVGSEILMRFQRTDQSANVYLNEGYALVVDVSDTGAADSMDNFTIQMTGSGPLTSIFTPTPINPNGKMKRLEYTGVAGEYFFTSAALNLVDVIDVVVDGGGRSKIITSGTPVNQEAKYTSALGVGRIEIPQPMESGTEVYVLYQDI